MRYIENNMGRYIGENIRKSIQKMQVFAWMVVMYWFVMSRPPCSCDNFKTSGSNSSFFINVTDSSCFVRNMTDIYWKVETRSPSNERSVQELAMYLQTKNDYVSFAEWQNTTNCTLDNHDKHRHSLVCRISKPVHYRVTDTYSLRLLVFSDDEQQYISIVSRGQPYNGFPCYPNHNIQNLTQVRITETSIGVSWDLNQWDTLFLFETTLNVNNIGGGLDRQIELTPEKRRHQYALIEGLEPEKEYYMCVISVFYQTMYNSEACIPTGVRSTSTPTATRIKEATATATAETTSTRTTTQQRLDHAAVSKHSHDKTGIVVGFLVGLSLTIALAYVGFRLIVKGWCRPGSDAVIRWPGLGNEVTDDGVALLSHPFTIGNGADSTANEDAVYV